MTASEDKITRVTEFRQKLLEWNKNHDQTSRAWLNQNKSAVRQIVLEVGCLRTITISPPPMVGGLIMQNVDMFDMLFESPYRMNLAPRIYDMLDAAIGVLREPVTAVDHSDTPVIESEVRTGYAFVAMPMDRDDPALVDVLEGIKTAGKECGVTAERIDDDERSERISDRILQSIERAEFVIVDLTNGKPNVFFEAGYAHGRGKLPIYIAREGTQLHFDVKDYPVITFRNIKELRERLVKRLMAIAERRH
jgi:hypothetical protein